jgi:hypothetical protein
MLAGCDYTAGVRGVGCVRALEILAEFVEPPAVVTETRCPWLEALRSFALWVRSNNNDRKEMNGARRRLAQQLGDICLPDSFPDQLVYDAFMRVCGGGGKCLLFCLLSPTSTRLPSRSHGRL